MSAADDMRDRFIAHQIYLQRFAGGLRNRLLEVLNKSDDPLAAKLKAELESFEGLTPEQTAKKFQQLEVIVGKITGVRDEAWQQVQADFLDEIHALAEHEYDFTTSVLRVVLPDAVDVIKVPAEKIAAAVGSRPFQGRLLKDWADDLQDAERKLLSDRITQGIIEGRTIDEMVRVVRGSKAADYADGILQISRRNAESVVRTAVNHVSNVARDDVFAANADIIAGVKWVSTLDGRTSTICRARDGHVAPIAGREDELPAGYPRLTPSNARPPAHWGCRSTVVAVFDLATISEQLGERPYVRDSRTRKQREIDFRKEAKADVGEAEWKRLGEEGRKPLIKAKRDAWATANIGRVPAGVTYDEWLRKQPAAFQDDVLGKGKAQLFRQGMKLDRFVDQAGKEMTLKQLLEKSGLDLKPSIRIKIEGQITADFKDGIRETIAQLPPSVMKSLSQAKVKLKTGESIVAMYPKLRGVRPRGWTAGTYEECGGFFDSETKLVNLGEYVRDPFGQWVRHPHIFFTLRHEIGHAWDEFGFEAGKVSDLPEFIAAFDVEMSRIKFASSEVQSLMQYFDQDDPIASREEFVAQAFALATGTGANKARDEAMRKTFPKSIEFIKKLLK